MDPLSQAVAGAALSGSFAKKKACVAALLIGALAGMAPDLDVLIRSSKDPLIALQYHRHFTHSLLLAPLWGVICAGFFWLFPWVRNRLSYVQTALFSVLGLITHGLLDSCTGYGTHLFWPLTNVRESWNIIGIIDPLYTLPALALLLVAGFRRLPHYALNATIWMLAYLFLGAYQQYRAVSVAEDWVTENQVVATKLTLRPTIGNLWLWRMLYFDQTEQRWQAHGLYLPYWNSQVKIKLGEAAQPYEFSQRDGEVGSVLYNDLQRFAFFSDGYLSEEKNQAGRVLVGDVRYSMLPHQTRPLWAIELPDDDAQHVSYHRALRRDVAISDTLSALKGEGYESLENSAKH